MSDVFKPRSVACPRCECAMGEVVTIAPLQDQPGLIAYECPACLYVMSEIVPAQPVQANLPIRAMTDFHAADALATRPRARPITSSVALGAVVD
jgi:hypothetical protein